MTRNHRHDGFYGFSGGGSAARTKIKRYRFSFRIFGLTIRFV